MTITYSHSVKVWRYHSSRGCRMQNTGQYYNLFKTIWKFILLSTYDICIWIALIWIKHEKQLRRREDMEAFSSKYFLALPQFALKIKCVKITPNYVLKEDQIMC